MTGLLRNAHAGETLPLLRSRSKSELSSISLLAKWKSHLNARVNRDWADVLLILCFLITGLLDSSCIAVWGSFVSMQTGNSVYIGLGLAAPTESKRWIKSAVSVLSFCVGSFVFSQFHHYFSPRRRWVLCVSFLVQMAITVVAASIVTCSPTPHIGEDEITWHNLLPISLVAFQSAGQAVTSRVLKYDALTTVALTGIYRDLFSDIEAFTLRNPERNRRLGAPVSLLIGAFLGGRFAHSSFGVAGALWTASALKMGVVVAWLVWPPERAVHEDE